MNIKRIITLNKPSLFELFFDLGWNSGITFVFCKNPKYILNSIDTLRYCLYSYIPLSRQISLRMKMSWKKVVDSGWQLCYIIRVANPATNEKLFKKLNKKLLDNENRS